MATTDGTPTQSITIEVNDTQFVLSEDDFRQLLLYAVPQFFQSSAIPAPDPVSDMIRGGLKTIAVMPTGFGKPNLLHTILFKIYGAAAPKIGKKDDKLPYIWRAISDFLVAKAREHRIVVTVAETSEEGVYRVASLLAIPLSSPVTGTHTDREPASAATGHSKD